MIPIPTCNLLRRIRRLLLLRVLLGILLGVLLSPIGLLGGIRLLLSRVRLLVLLGLNLAELRLARAGRGVVHAGADPESEMHDDKNPSKSRKPWTSHIRVL